MNEDDRPPVLRRLSPLTPVVRGPILVLAFLGATWQQLLDQGDRGLLALLLLGLLVAGIAYGTASWFLTHYSVTRDELRIDTGVVNRRSRRIRIDRLQGIDVVQPFTARLLGLAELRFDVAAGGEREGSLAFLPHAEALELRRMLLERRDDLRGVVAVDSAPSSAPPPERLLARLDLQRLLLSLVLSTESLVLGAFSVASTVLLVKTGRVAIAGAVLPLVIGLVVTVIRRLLAYYGFELTETPSGLQVHRGLTAVSTQTIVPARVQGLLVAEPLLWRPLGWARLEVSVAGYRSGDAERAQASSTLVPVGPRAEVMDVVRDLLGHDGIDAVPLSRPPGRARWRAPLAARTVAFGLDDRLVVSRRGVLSRRLDIVPRARVQSVRLAQGPLHRLLRLVRVDVDSPPGPVSVVGRVRGVDEGSAVVRELAGEEGQPNGDDAPPAHETTQWKSPNPPGAVSSAASAARDSDER